MANKRLRQNSLSFLGGLIGLVSYLILVVLTNSGYSAEQDVMSLVLTLLGAILTTYLFSRFLPWLNRQFSASKARRTKTYKIDDRSIKAKPRVVWHNLKKRFKL